MVPPVLPTEGEDEVEAALSLLIDLMGGSAFELFMIHNFGENTVESIQVPRPEHPPTSELIPGVPRIFYGSRKGTHFTCTPDGITVWNSYKEGVQLYQTDHFCQTFTLMRMVYALSPSSFVGKMYETLMPYEFLDNVMTAIQVAGNVLIELDTHYRSIMEEYIYIAMYEDNGTPRHIINPALKTKDPHKMLSYLVGYCQCLTAAQLCDSSFREKIFR